MDVTRDGERFVVNTLGGDEGESLAIVTNWFRALAAEPAVAQRR
jgi:hypothetical protein